MVSKPNNPPALPMHVSKDGREIWDWAGKLGNWSERQHNIRELKAEIADLRFKRCGNCKDWMKSRECPREHNVKGMSRGPSSGTAACNQFSRNWHTTDLLAEKEAGLSAMLAERECTS